MSNYLSKIASRSTGLAGTWLPPAPAITETAFNDPFEQTVPAINTTGPASVKVPSTAITPTSDRDLIVPTRPSGDPLAKATEPAQQTPEKPAYLSTYFERYLHTTRELAAPVIGKEPGGKVSTEAKFQSPALPIFPPEQNRPTASQTVSPPAIQPIQMQHRGESTGLLPKLNKGTETPPGPSGAPSVLQPVARWSQQDAGQGLLPPQPFGSGKEPSVPKLVIGKITVEIIPASQPVNKIIHQVIKSQPSIPAAPRSKSSFGLGQL